MKSLTFVPIVAVLSVVSMSGCGHKIIRPDETPDTPAADVHKARNPDLEMTHFAFNSAILTEAGKRVLKQDAEALVNDSTIKIQAQGFCDDRGSVGYNLALGERRARAVKAYLESLGVSGERIATVSFGKSRPLDPKENEQAWAMNRRASFVIQSQNKEVAYR